MIKYLKSLFRFSSNSVKKEVHNINIATSNDESEDYSIEDFDNEFEDEPLLEQINILAKKLVDNESENILPQTKQLANELTLDEMIQVVDFYYKNADEYYPDKIHFKRKGVVIRLCIAFGEEICTYIDKVAFEGEKDWVQSDAIDLLCRMSLAGNIRTKKTLQLINKNIDSFRETTTRNTLESIHYFKENPIVIEIYERQIIKLTKDFPEIAVVFEMYGLNYKNEIIKHLPFLKEIVFYKTQNEGEKYVQEPLKYEIEIDEFGNKTYNITEIKEDPYEWVEAYKIRVALSFYSIDTTDDDINAFLYYTARNSAHEKHKDFIKNSMKYMN